MRRHITTPADIQVCVAKDGVTRHDLQPLRLLLVTQRQRQLVLLTSLMISVIALAHSAMSLPWVVLFAISLAVGCVVDLRRQSDKGPREIEIDHNGIIRGRRSALGPRERLNLTGRWHRMPGFALLEQTDGPWLIVGLFGQTSSEGAHFDRWLEGAQTNGWRIPQY